MLVKELIAKLAALPQDLPVVIYLKEGEDGNLVGDAVVCEGSKDEPYYKGCSPFEKWDAVAKDWKAAPKHVLITD